MSFSQIESELEAMSLPEKLRLMESLWANLSRDETNLESPAWHGDVLRERQSRVKAGESTFMDWESTKQQLRDRFK